MSEIIIERRFQGPSQSANGGYFAGLLAELIDGPAEITLRAPPPLETPLELAKTADGYEVLHEGNAVGSVRPGSFSVEVPAKPSDAEIEAALPNYPGAKNSPIPHCFVCGVKNAPGEGLRVFASPIEGRDLVAAKWDAHPNMAGDDGFILERHVFAALDCPGAYAWFGQTSGSMLLGRIAGEVTGKVKAGDRCTVLAWREGIDGRKAYAGSAVLDADERVVASAFATWITVPSVS
ncbi:MAG: hypothetical protein ACMVY4_19055 [Minwuia sp.]|uniref:hypothetical protein n=1 Tax=Minwuia sp. TaxID=2493630 RepID=UPI003A853784